MSSPAHVPAFLHGLVDDAAIFPPGDLPLADAVPAHLRHRAEPYGALLGAFVIDDRRLPQLADLVPQDGEPVRLSVVVSGGAGGLEPAVLWAARTPGVRLRGVEVALRDELDLAQNARRVVAAADRLVAEGSLPDDVPVYVEPPRLRGGPVPASWLAALDEVAAADLRLKLRTGGPDPDAVPLCEELAEGIEAALDRELPFKCTAGLHHAVRGPDPQTGVTGHGFLNVLHATRVALDGAGPAAVAATLAATEAPDPDPDGWASARRWFTSFGSCSVADPVEDLRTLGLL